MAVWMVNGIQEWFHAREGEGDLGRCKILRTTSRVTWEDRGGRVCWSGRAFRNGMGQGCASALRRLEPNTPGPAPASVRNIMDGMPWMCTYYVMYLRFGQSIAECGLGSPAVPASQLP